MNGRGDDEVLPRLRLNAFTSGPSAPSARFRVRQYIEPLRSEGIEVVEHPAFFGTSPRVPGRAHRTLWFASALAERAWSVARAPRADAALVQKEMIRTLFTAERLLRDPMLLDVDDAIWLEQRWSAVDTLARRSRGVVCGNRVIAEYMSALGCRVGIVPTAVDTDRYRPAQASPDHRDGPIIGWIGMSSGLPELAAVADQVWSVLTSHPEWSLMVVSDDRPELPHIDSARIRYVRWSPEAELAALGRMSIGLMPLRPSPWNEGKCSYKALTYMASAVPGVISPVGMNKDLIAAGAAVPAGDESDAWSSALDRLISSDAERRRLGLVARDVAESVYSTRSVACQLAETIRTFLS